MEGRTSVEGVAAVFEAVRGPTLGRFGGRGVTGVQLPCLGLGGGHVHGVVVERWSGGTWGDVGWRARW